MVCWNSIADKAVGVFEAWKDSDLRPLGVRMNLVRQLVPDWAFPVVRLSTKVAGKPAEQVLLDEARLLAKSAEERGGIDAYRETISMPFAERSRLSEIGMRRRRASVVLERARLELQTDVDFRRSFITDAPPPRSQPWDPQDSHN